MSMCHVWRSEVSLPELVLSFHMEPGWVRSSGSVTSAIMQAFPITAIEMTAVLLAVFTQPAKSARLVDVLHTSNVQTRST